MKLGILKNGALVLSIVCAIGLQAHDMMSSVTSVATTTTGFDDSALSDYQHFNFIPDKEMAGCNPGEECDAVIANSDDYFQSEDLPGSNANTVVLFSKEDVDKIIQEKIEHCKNDPKSCGIETGLSDKVTDVGSIVNSVQGKDIPIAGYYLHYGEGSYDWLYMDPKATYVFKLEEGVTKNGGLRWTPVDTSKNKVFESIQVDPVNNVVHFGSANSLPGISTVDTTETTESDSATTATEATDTVVN